MRPQIIRSVIVIDRREKKNIAQDETDDLWTIGQTDTLMYNFSGLRKWSEFFYTWCLLWEPSMLIDVIFLVIRMNWKIFQNEYMKFLLFILYAMSQVTCRSIRHPPASQALSKRASFTISLFQMINYATAYLHCDLSVCGEALLEWRVSLSCLALPEKAWRSFSTPEKISVFFTQQFLPIISPPCSTPSLSQAFTPKL